MKKFLVILVIAGFAQTSLATDPSEMAHQCEQYGSYQNAEGEWLTCEIEEDSGEYEEQETESDETPNDYVEENAY